MRYLLTILAFLFSTSLFAADPDSTFNVEISDKLTYTFYISYFDNSEVIRNVGFNEYSTSGIVLVENIRFQEDDFVHYINFDDYNFDGYLDMYVHDPCMILGNCHGKIYLFEKNRFSHDPQFDDMTTVIADPETKEIYSSNRSAAGSIFTNETFKWQGGILILTERVSQNYDGDFYIYTVEELAPDGTMKITKQERLSEPRLD